MTISDLLERAEVFDPYKAIRDSIEATGEQAVLYNIEQLLKGEKADGEPITPEYYYQDYARYKNTINPVPGMWTPDLRDSGAFQDGFFISKEALEADELEIDSYDEKTEALTAKYSDSIFGLNEESGSTYFSTFVIDFFATLVLEDLNLVMR